ncbi:carbohydrate-binding protein [Pyxidicoccus fallax]|uniref:Carbohydrate-binding protein n=1 Tax=Pyxidicoccus fallax TaxID=394095 RepID=A0A848LMK4_9BACT|nr:heparin lyase I family protein [Pyxidicoccus fallax]NMO18919.1 carbohydrate-binding protein [Pyxidicoccus fallax]NPC79539.1 carbohydrate-binding protein [Pyxidicoccus fallax]
MKKTLLLVGTLLGIGGAGCGAYDPSTEVGEAPDTLGSTADALTASNCTQLTATSVIASGNDGNVPANTMDDRLDTRWSNLGKGSWIDYDLGATKTVSGATIAWHNGNTRANTFTVSVSPDGYTYTQVYSGKSSGTTTAAETYGFPAVSARRLRITVNGSTLNDWASISEARACAGGTTTPPPTGSSVVWVGDFETGDRSQWSKTQMVSADRLALVASPLRQGRYALKATVKQGDDPINSSGNRNELVRLTREPAGSEYYYRWSTMFDSTFPSAKTWQLFTQWHHEGNSGSPPVEFYVNGEEIHLKVGGNPGTIVWRTPLVRAQWQDFIFHVKWSPNASVGFVELYHNGKLVLPKRYIATQYSGQLNYLKIGLYRNDTISQTGIVYHDGWTMARTLQDVLSPTSVLTAP